MAEEELSGTHSFLAFIVGKEETFFVSQGLLYHQTRVCSIVAGSLVFVMQMRYSSKAGRKALAFQALPPEYVPVSSISDSLRNESCFFHVRVAIFFFSGHVLVVSL